MPALHTISHTRPRPAHVAPGGALHCPLCDGALLLDSWRVSPLWLCQAGHSYSNAQVLRAEMRGREPPLLAAPVGLALA